MDQLGERCKLRLSHLDPEKGRNVGGTGMIDFQNKHIIRPKPMLPALAELAGQGRVDLFVIEPIANQCILCYVVYGYTKEDDEPANAARTDHIAALCIADSAV